MKTKTAAVIGIKSLYHYQSLVKPERLARIFTEGTLYFSRPRDFNDPWDCRPFFDKSALDDPTYYDRAVSWFAKCHIVHSNAISTEEYQRRINELHSNRRLLEGMIDQISENMENSIQNQYRVFCLTTHPDSIRMWAHYAAGFHGVCLEFTVNNDLFCHALPISYQDDYPRFDVTASDPDENLQPLLTKSSAWSYEDEYRVIVSEHPFRIEGLPTAKNGLLPLPTGSLRSVIIGTKMPASDREVVKSLVRVAGWDTRIKVANLVPDRYEFEIVELQQ